MNSDSSAVVNESNGSDSLLGSRTFDFIVLGATGFTGAYVAKYIRKSCPGIRWAIVGRSLVKLSELIKELTAIPSTEPLPAVLVADISDKGSLVPTFATSSIVLNCTGPYRFLGDAVVEACLAARAHYMDICGEPQFMETCFLKYNKLAADFGVLIIHACAFDSVPADLGVLFTSRQFMPQCCSSVESFLSIIAPNGIAGHYTTYECAVHGFGDAASLKKVRRDIDAKYKVKTRHVGPKLNKERGTFFYEDRMESYAIPFMGADASVVRSSQRSLSLNKSLDVWPQYAAYATVGSAYNVATTAVYGGVFSALAGFELGRSLLLKCPEFFTNGIFSHAGPSETQLASTRFEMHFFASGFSQPVATSGSVVLVAPTTRLATADIKDNTDADAEIDADKHSQPIATIMTTNEAILVDPDNTPHGETVDSAVKEASASSSAPILSIATETVGYTPSLKETCLSWNKSVLSAASSAIPTSVPSLSGGASSEGIVGSGNWNNDGDMQPDMKVHVVVRGAEPGYVATPAIFVTLALCLLEERHSMGSGVMTPSAAYFDSLTVFKRLTEAGLDFQVL